MKKYKYIIIAGCSRFGANIASLLSSKGNDVVIIDKEKTSFKKLINGYSGFQMQGDATDINILRDAGIEKADIVLAATDDDNINIMVSEIARKIFQVRSVVSRIYDNEKEIVFSDLGIKIIRLAELSINEFEKVGLQNLSEVF